MAKFIFSLKVFSKAEEGATMVEYGLMLALIAVVCIAFVGLIGINANTVWNAVANTL